MTFDGKVSARPADFADGFAGAGISEYHSRQPSLIFNLLPHSPSRSRYEGQNNQNQVIVVIAPWVHPPQLEVTGSNILKFAGGKLS